MGILDNLKHKMNKWIAEEATPKAITSSKTEKTAKVDKTKPVMDKQPKKLDTQVTEVKKADEVVLYESYSSIDSDLESQIMQKLANPEESLSGTASKADSEIPENTGMQPVSDSKVTATTETQPAAADISSESTNVFAEPFFPKKVIKRLKNKKLTIILVENTATVAKQKDKVLQIVQNFVRSDLMCIISYGSTVNASEIIDAKNGKNLITMYDEGAGEETCLFDALVELEKIVSSKYMVIEETETERVSVNSIDVIGIGTCTDNCSTTTKTDAIDKFYSIARKSKVVTKYYCLTDEYFIGAAEIGFHSIGAISKAYQ